jgi:site-specific recombinase XerD
MSESYPQDQIVGAAARAGPLGQHLAAYVEHLGAHGYTHATIRWQLCLLSVFGRWLDRAGLAVGDLNEEVIGRHVEEDRGHGRWVCAIPGVLRRFVEHLRAIGVVPVVSPALPAPDDFERVGQRYRMFLEQERGLAEPTIENYLGLLRRFLVHRFGEGPVHTSDLGPEDAAHFLLEHAHKGSPGRASLMVTTLRSFFRFLLQHGEISIDLAASVPTVANWRRTKLPRYVEPGAVEQVLEACDRSTAMGRRDYAILILLARLGLRAGEVVMLRLDDVNWREGTLAVRGKGALHDRLPLPEDVGEALADYLRHGRLHDGRTRRLFVRARAPLRGFANAGAVTTLVQRAVHRSGIEAPIRGAYLFRHSLATGMLRGGASLAEVGEVLRHRSTNSTEIYAKVDLRSLREVAATWPVHGGSR